MEILLIILGILLTGIATLAVRWVRSIPILEISPSVFNKKVGPNETHTGVGISVRNCGFSEFPEYRLLIALGGEMTLDAFEPNPVSSLAPHQSNEQRLVLRINGIARGNFQHLFDNDETQFSLRLVRSKSEQILFESNELGSALCVVARNLITHGRDYYLAQENRSEFLLLYKPDPLASIRRLLRMKPRGA